MAITLQHNNKKIPPPEPKTVNARGLVFLLGYSALAAVLNYLTTLRQTSVAQETPYWELVAGWAIVILFYVPIYWIFIHSVRRWKWSLDEWGFGLKGRPWLAICLASIALLVVWLPLPGISIGSMKIGDFGNLRSGFGQADIPFLIFEGYARVAEELLYRGFALVLLRRIFSSNRYNWLWAILISSALFAVVHTHRVSQMLQLFLGAAIPLAVFTLWTRSISTAFVIHAIAGGGPIGALFSAVTFAGVAIFNAIRKRSN